jgi:DNA-binding beta-propeller fold protein YncE
LNGRFALSVDGSSATQDIVSYSLADNAFVSALPTSAQAVAISPITNDLVLTAEFFLNNVRRFTLDNNGILGATIQEFPAGNSPINLIFSPDGLFAFVANSTTPGSVSVLSTQNPGNIVLIDSAATTSRPQSLAVTRDGGHVFALGASNVDVFSFDAVAGSLTLENSFAHGLSIDPFFGVDQIALDPDDIRLFISGRGTLAVFTTYGLPLGTVSGAAGPGGLDIARSAQPSDPCWQDEE